MKILLATYWLIPHVGGVWKYMLQIQQRLEAMGHQVDLLGNSPDYSKFHIVNRGQELSKTVLRPLISAKLAADHAPELHQDPLIYSYEEDRYFMELSAAYFGLGGYDVIHTQDIFAARAMERVKPAHVPLVAQVHGSVSLELHNHFRQNPQLGIQEHSPAWKYFKSIEYHGASSGQLTITSTQWQKNTLVHGFGISEHRIEVFPYGLESELFWQNAQKGTDVQKPPGKKVIIVPARLASVKGIDVLISALGMLKYMRDDWVCWIVGEGEKREELQQQTAGLSLQNDVVFMGERHDVPALLMQSDIFVHSCIQDNQPFSVMEAQIAGLPACVSNAGGLPEMVEHGVTGLVSPVRDPLTLARHLHLLLENDQFRLMLGRNAANFAREHWSMDQMIEKLMNAYAKVGARI
ncbi:glycosyltransferase family 4 protein [Paenibacillus donghaensis]|uniref:glycosyltransferase family 4 protein n=1 Tax=Paenibacillus donghaensis TaxID=414771 RepID=UPI0018848102|nr:glycosyltransferase family 4 protein [Paenibacillus donghaensis]MBE9916014.1 glycosyltransferase family 4 protein [Paenibacillus donghaensis]